jgi:hypothetical protein
MTTAVRAVAVCREYGKGAAAVTALDNIGGMLRPASPTASCESAGFRTGRFNLGE